MLRLFKKIPTTLKLVIVPFKSVAPIPKFHFAKTPNTKAQKKIDLQKEKSEAHVPDEIDFDPFEKNCDKIFRSFEDETKTIKIGKLTPDIFKKIHLPGKDHSLTIYDVAQIVPVDATRCDITPFEASHKKLIHQALERDKFYEFEVKQSQDDAIVVSVPVGNTKEKKDKLIKMIHEIGEKHKEKLRDVRHEFIKSQEKFQKFLSKDVTKAMQQEINKESEKATERLEKMIKLKEKEFK